MSEVKKATTAATQKGATNAQLKKENEELRSKIDELASMVQQLMSGGVNATTKQEPSASVDLTKKVQVVSMRRGVLNLKCGNRIYRFEKFGETKRISLSDLEMIKNDNPSSFYENGYYYVADKDAAKYLDLDGIYGDNVNKKMVQTFFDNKLEDVEEIFKELPSGVQETIAGIASEKIFNGEDIDYNKVSVISRIIGKDIYRTTAQLKEAFDEE